VFVTIHRKRNLTKWVKCFLDGRDVSAECYAANDKKGIALCYRVRDGKIVQQNGSALRELRRGRVELKIRDDAPVPVYIWFANKKGFA
jgi:hypothetical protein